MAGSTNINLVNSVLIGSGTNSEAAADLTPTTLAKGDLALALEDGTIIATNGDAAALTPDTVVHVVMGLGDGGLKKSSPLSGNTVKTCLGKKFRAPSLQTTYLGYDGTTFQGFPIADETEYQMNILIKDDQRTHGQKQTAERYNVTSPDDATSEGVMFEFLKLFYTRMSNGTQKRYRGRFVDMSIIHESTTVLATAASNGTFTKNSPYVEFVAGHGFAAGDIIRVGGTAVTDPLYKVKSITDANNLVLTTPYIGASAIIPAPSITSIDVNDPITIANNFAVCLTSQAPKIVIRDEWEIVAFTASMFKTASFSYAPEVDENEVTKPDFGSGFWKVVEDREFFAQGYEGVTSRTKDYDWTTALAPTFYTEPGKEYHSITLSGLRSQYEDFQNTRTNPVADEIYIPIVNDPAAAGDQAFDGAEDFVHIFNGYFADVLKFVPITFA